MQYWSDNSDPTFGDESFASNAITFGAHSSDYSWQAPGQNLRDEAEARLRQTQRRLQWLQQVWDDPGRFEAVVASGRYLKLCTLLEWASDNDERAALKLTHIEDGTLSRRAAERMPA